MPVDPTEPFAPDQPAVSVMLLVVDRVRRERLRGCFARSARPVRLRVVETVVDAMLRFPADRPDLLVVDLMAAGGAGPVLVRQLARTAPRSLVLLFDDAAGPAIDGHVVWPWSRLDDVVGRGLESRAANPPLDGSDNR